MRDFTYAVLYSTTMPVQFIDTILFDTMGEASECAERILKDERGRVYGIIKCDITKEEEE